MLEWIRRASGTRPLSHVFVALVLMAGLEAALLVACADALHGPKNVAREFWTALNEKDLARAKTYASRDSAGRLRLPATDGLGDLRAELGDERKAGETATVETTVMVGSDGKEYPVALQTSLVKEDGAWKVDVDRTFRALWDGSFAAVAGEMGRLASGML